MIVTSLHLHHIKGMNPSIIKPYSACAVSIASQDLEKFDSVTLRNVTLLNVPILNVTLLNVTILDVTIFNVILLNVTLLMSQSEIVQDKYALIH